MNITTLDDIKRWRHHIHSRPELSMQEFETAKYIRTELEKMDIKYMTPMQTATIVYLEGKSDKTIMLRADIDALPIMEENNIEYKSLNPGVMHACGHDAHATMLLGATKELNELYKSGELANNVLIVFQPSEEANSGAYHLIKNFDFRSYNITAAFALHVNPDYEEGTIISRSGAIMASCNEYHIDFHGKSAHVGLREKGINALHAAVMVYQELSTIPTYYLDSKHTNIIHVGKMDVGEVMNAVPSFGHIQGTIRTYDIKDRELIKKRIKEICDGIEKSTKCRIEPRFNPAHPPVMNVQKLIPYAEKATMSVGAKFILKEYPYLLGEDFSFYSDIAPINFSFIGIRNEELKYTSGLHTPTIMMRDEVLPYGVDYFVNIANAEYQ
ncbi:M20 metallopeptidase family protein [Peptostreptococcus equinus]|uniref:M20 family metallopeptidase n=1 Tax=Peptostreptococcus equinus TaxID=3003601 RepID=A0ABY7JNG0_9FIRM|nr:M20 family metallopeptidase [Peptostreptococcus sp. CBA3647]WAW14704.1 M20 family metallopeptidase [Peptostreptococcus sp. CBA3647]